MDLYRKPDGAWHLSPEQVEWLNGAQEREAALREENARLRAEASELTRRAVVAEAKVKRLEGLILEAAEYDDCTNDIADEAKRIRGEK